MSYCWNLDHKLIVYCEICQSSNVTTPYILVSHTVFNSRIMIHDVSITCCDFKKYVTRVPCHDFSSMFDMCEIGPWGLIDPTIILCKALDDEVIIIIPFCSVTDKIIPPTFDSWPTIEINNYIVTWLADSMYNDYHAVDWNIAWVFKIVRSISSAQRHDSPPVKHLHFKQWDPGGRSLVYWKNQHAWEAFYKNENSGSS